MATQASLETIEDFLSQKRIAMAGISRDPKSLSVTLFEELCRRGYDVVPVNPNTMEVQGRRCFARVQDIQPPVEAALLMTSPEATETVVNDCAEAGIQRVHHNVETARSYYDEVTTTVRYQGRLRTIQAVREAGLETCVGGILNLGESREQRVEMAFELADIDPTSVPINMLNPRPGTKFGDREYMDPWEAVKWIAIFRLILPNALFRLCGGRVENLGELQRLAVRAGINGVMMGNFLTTLGNAPEQDREMFEELGLNVARQPDNAADPRPDNRSGWLCGETPDVLAQAKDREQPAATVDLGVRLWDPSTQLRHQPKRAVARRPDGAANRVPVG